ncbi:MAG: hypothetical protein JXR51_03180 [Bacteroidales bacterium]|nr:hypothetical protein [Bacteroidales bacterium]MBN2756154.1 hypothetical protein [Bacteroidales bacterium]
MLLILKKTIFNIFIKLSNLFDILYNLWESKKSLRFIGSVIVFSYVFTLILIQFKQWEILPEFLSNYIPSNHFYAIEVAFTFLLIVEILGMIFVLSHSVSESVAKQFEIFSLILLRQAFKDFGEFSEPFIWSENIEQVIKMLSDTFGALIIFIVILYFKRMQKHIKITCSDEDQGRFDFVKKILSVLMIFTFAFAGIYSIYANIILSQEIHFFKAFYTALIFTDILIVLISIRYSHLYIIVFRNSGFALATVIIRLALTAPPYINISLGILASIFILGLSYTYNNFRVIK